MGYGGKGSRRPEGLPRFRRAARPNARWSPREGTLREESASHPGCSRPGVLPSRLRGSLQVPGRKPGFIHWTEPRSGACTMGGRPDQRPTGVGMGIRVFAIQGMKPGLGQSPGPAPKSGGENNLQQTHTVHVQSSLRTVSGQNPDWRFCLRLFDDHLARNVDGKQGDCKLSREQLRL